MTTNCLRCDQLCQTGIPDLKARAIRKSVTEGFCPDCMITFFLLSIEPIRDIIEGTPERGTRGKVWIDSREGKGPEVLLSPHIRENFLAILSFTQLREDEINWINVVLNWGLAWPKGHEPKVGANY